MPWTGIVAVRRLSELRMTTWLPRCRSTRKPARSNARTVSPDTRGSLGNGRDLPDGDLVDHCIGRVAHIDRELGCVRRNGSGTQHGAQGPPGPSAGSQEPCNPRTQRRARERRPSTARPVRAEAPQCRLFVLPAAQSHDKLLDERRHVLGRRPPDSVRAHDIIAVDQPIPHADDAAPGDIGQLRPCCGRHTRCGFPGNLKLANQCCARHPVGLKLRTSIALHKRRRSPGMIQHGLHRLPVPIRARRLPRIGPRWSCGAAGGSCRAY